jgi:hypothetical protein
MNIVKVKSAMPGELPFSKNTVRKYHSLKKYPQLLYKVAGNLVFDVDEWNKMVQSAKDTSISEAKRIWSTNAI